MAAAVVLTGCSLVSWREYRRFRTPENNGLYAPPSSPGQPAPCFDYHQAAQHAGENGCVSGYVLRAYTSKAGNTFLDFCPDYKTCPFSTVIFASDSKKFGDLETLTGRYIEIHGFITLYHGKAEIIIHDAGQIRRAR